MRVLVLLLVLLLPGPAAAVEGRAVIVDGDTLRIGPERVRLHGIDAPELAQHCLLGGKAWACGRASRDALAAFVGASSVVCEGMGRDRWRRLIAVCHARGVDLGWWLVRNGHALAFRRYSENYVKAENQARAERLGLWRSTFDPPWVWRAMRRR